MERVCFQLQVKPEKIAEYVERHRAVWPEMQQALTESGWTNYSLFLREDGLLIGYVETDNFAGALERMNATEVNSKWQREMAVFFSDAGTMLGTAGPLRLTEVFHLD